MTKKANGFIILILFFSSLFFWPSLMDKYQVSRFLLQTAILLGAGYLFYESFKKQRSATLNLIDFAFLGYYLIHIISTFWAYDLGEAVFTNQKILISFAIYYFTRLLLARTKIDVLNTLVWSSFALTAALLVYMPIELFKVTSGNGFTNEVLYNVSGAMGNKSLLSEFLLLLIPLNLIGAIKTPKKTWFYSLVFLQLLLILILQVRTTYLVLIVCGSIYIIWGLLNFNLFRKKILTRFLPVGAGISALLFGLVRFGGIFPDLAERLNINTWAGSNTVAERLFIWYKTTYLISENWLFGVGSGSWKIYFPSNSIRGSWRFETLDTFATRVHNDFLEIFAETGILGLLCYLAIFFLAFYAGIKAMRTADTAHKKMIFAVCTGLLGYTLIAAVDFPKERLEHQTLFAVLLALCAHWGKDHLVAKGLQKPAKWYPGFFGILMGLLATNLYSGALRFNGEVHIRKAIAAKNAQNWPLLVSESKKSNSKMYRLDPNTVPVSWYEGIGYFHQNEGSKAHAAFEQAYKHNPYNYHVLNNLGTTLAQQEKYKDAVPLFEEALRINPSFEDCKFNLAFALYHLGDYEQALFWANQTSESEKKKVFLQTIMAVYNPASR